MPGEGALYGTPKTVVYDTLIREDGRTFLIVEKSTDF